MYPDWAGFGGRNRLPFAPGTAIISCRSGADETAAQYVKKPMPSTTALQQEPASRIAQRVAIAEAALSFAGAGIAGTLWGADRVHKDVPCSANGGCAIVASSAWSHIDLIVLHDVPVALLGLAGYVALLTLAMLRLGTESARTDGVLRRLIWLFAGGGAAYSWYLQWVAHVKIGAFCVWCRSSALVMTTLLLLATWEWWAAHRRQKENREAHG